MKVSDKRTEAIKTLEDIIATVEGIEGLSEDAGIIIGINKIDSLKFALESVKVDRAYDLAYEKVDFIEIPEGATNRDVIRAAFDETMAYNIEYYTENYMLQGEWLDSPYRKEQE